MGISLNKNNAFTVTDAHGNTKFSLDKRMPHIIHTFSGVVNVPTIYNTDYSLTTIDRVDTVVTLSNSYIATSFQDSFILPFYKITGGFSDTESYIVSGTGSTIVRKIFQPTTREFLGSSIIDIVQENGELKIVCNQQLDRTGYSNIDGDSVVSLSYKIYYGRFN
jgi:hypothetical protein